MVATLLGWKGLWEKAMGFLWDHSVLRLISQRVFLSIISGFYAFDGQYSNSKHYAYSSISCLSTSEGIYWLITMQEKNLLLGTNVPSKLFASSLENYTVILSFDVSYLCNVKWHTYILITCILIFSWVFQRPLRWNGSITIPMLSCSSPPLFRKSTFVLWRLLIFTLWNNSQNLQALFRGYLWRWKISKQHLFCLIYVTMFLCQAKERHQLWIFLVRFQCHDLEQRRDLVCRPSGFCLYFLPTSKSQTKF